MPSSSSSSAPATSTTTTEGQRLLPPSDDNDDDAISLSPEAQTHDARNNTSKPPPGWLPSTSTVNAVLMSCSFCLIFVAFSSAQNFATSRPGKVGANAVGILYVAFMLSTLFITVAVNWSGPKVALVVGSLTYAVFVAANIPFTAATMYPAGVLVGFGAALLWTAQGVYITRCAEFHEAVRGLPAGSTMGRFNGIFWSIFQVSQFAGNLLVAVLFAEGVSTRAVFVVTTAVATAGSLSMLALRSLPAPPPAPGGGGDLNAMAMLGMFRDRSVLFLTPVMIYSGLSQGFIFGQFPTLIEDRTWKFLTMAAFGAVDAGASIVAGRLSDRLGRYALLTAGFVCHLLVFATLFVTDVPQHERGWFFALAAVLGVGDACYNTQLYAVLGAFFTERSQGAFACFKFLASASTAAGFFYAKHISDDSKLVIVSAAIVAGHACLSALHLGGESVNRGTKVR